MAPPVFSGSSSAATGPQVGHQDGRGLAGDLVECRRAPVMTSGAGTGANPRARLQGDVAGEAVGDHHVGWCSRGGPGPRCCRRTRIRVRLRLLSVRLGAPWALGKQGSAWASFTEAVPLVGSSPIESRATARIEPRPVAGGGVGRCPICGELHEHRRRALGVRSGVDQDRRCAADLRQRSGDGRAGPPRQAGPSAKGLRPSSLRCSRPRPWPRPSRTSSAARAVRSPSCGAPLGPGPPPCR